MFNSRVAGQYIIYITCVCVEDGKPTYSIWLEHVKCTHGTGKRLSDKAFFLCKFTILINHLMFLSSLSSAGNTEANAGIYKRG